MKTRITILFILGVGCVLSNPTTKATDKTNKEQTTESTKSEVQHEDTTITPDCEHSEMDTKEIIETTDLAENIVKNVDENVAVIVEENEVPSSDIKINNIYTYPVNDDFYKNPSTYTMNNEIMETAAGYIPTPLVFRRRQSPRRRYPLRRNYQRYPYYQPYRKMNYYYPYYSYYYRPSSLRYFY